MSNILWFDEIGMGDLARVGGKNASLGEMISHLATAGVRVPGGFATTAEAYQRFLAGGGLDGRIRGLVDGLETDDIAGLSLVGSTIRGWIEAQPFPDDLERDIREAHAKLISDDPASDQVTWAVRSSATAEDLPDASFAGQQETFLNIGGIENILAAVRSVYASLYNDRAIAYRVHHGFDHHDVALSAGIQRMVRSDVGASGVMFTVDTESGFDQAVFVTSSYGLGEAVVQGAVNPDEFYAYKPALRAGRPAILKRSVGEKAIAMRYSEGRHVGGSTVLVDVAPSDRVVLSISDSDVEELGRVALIIEEHYGRPMDIEWGKDGIDGKLYVLQARPETVVSRQAANVMRRFLLRERGPVLAEGRAIGQKIGAGAVRVLSSLDEMRDFAPGDVLVADMTDPDWEPVMKRASAIVTNRGGRTCHAAIIARELGIPAVVGTGDATRALIDGQEVTVSCAEGDEGFVYAGFLDFEEQQTELDRMPEAPVKIMMNVGTPDQAFSFAKLPHRGVGLARLEFIINRQIGIHPRALLAMDDLPAELRADVQARIAAYPSAREYFVRRVAEGISMIAAAFAPEPVIVRLSDFKSNEYASLIGGHLYEPEEENPMLGYRGASRYISPEFRECFDMECEAIRRVRDDMGLTNVQVMVPFVRTLDEAAAVSELLAQNGLRRGANHLKVIMMCEVPSNAILAEQFLDYFDGFSIGSNDMTQLTLGLDRDSSLVASTFDERDPAVRRLLGMAIDACLRQRKYVGICGQGPSDHPDFAEWLVARGVESLSLNPDAVVETWLTLAQAEDTPAGVLTRTELMVRGR
ncbi:phosphoenolpyruvate synthase [Microbacterium trichothecenolyticum]|uniref:Phosphoenolpyruvate synthase n=1 Tax=Microbacterium ureisolvens TaxID=2781186 RepID=A0ABS7HYG1_9MICO|nr:MULTISPECIES: phosphoenolpyruvate synthase [Microbacterium]MBW9110426.1 phosphoenolpyruvate synthase [Microbacterium ureisolvens]MBW9120531.1 phosphoenolpyruvate synthase [Microbacterium trichothecenolyticum]